MPDPYDRDTPDAPPTAGLRCPRCGGEPRLVVEDHAPTFLAARYYAEVTCCGMLASAAGNSALVAVNWAVDRWRLLYPAPAEDRDDG